MRNLIGRLRRPISRSQLTKTLTLISDGDGSTLSLDFASMGELDSRFTFTRNSIATYTNSSGIVTSVTAAATNDPSKARFDYNPTTLAPRGLLIEGSVTNELQRSNEFNTSPWYTLNFNTPTIASPSVTDPAGGTNTWYCVPSGSGVHGFRINTTFTAVAYTFSIWAKAAQHDKFIISDPGGGQGACRFDLTAKTASVIIGVVTPTNPQIIEYPNGWFRCSFTMVMPAALRGITYTSYPNGATISAFGANFTATGTDGMYFYGAQTEINSSASSYIPTGASAVQRAADVCTLSGTNFSSWFNSTAGTFLATGERAITSDFGRLLSANANNTTSAFDLGASTNGRWLITNATSQADITAGTVTANTAFKVAGAFASNDAQMAFNGTLGTADTSVSLPTVSQLDIGADRTAVYLNGRIRSIKFWPTRLPNATLQSLTA